MHAARFTRKRLALSSLGAIATTGLLRRPAGAAEFTFKFASNVPATHPTTVRVLEAARGIGKDSGGRIEVQVFPNSELGTDVAMMGQLRTGAVQFYSATGSFVANVVPLAAIEGVAFAFPTLQRAYQVMDGPFGANIRDAIRGAGLYTFDVAWSAGFHHVINSVRPVNVPTDLKGLKIRVPPAPLEFNTFKELGGSPQPVNLVETYAGLQTHLLDGAALPLATIESTKFYEVTKYLSLTHHLFTTFTMIANNDAMQSLPPNLRQIVDRNMNAAGTRQRADIVSVEDSFVTTLQTQGMTVNKTDTTPFRAAVRSAGLYGQWRDQFGAKAWGLLEKAVGSLG